MFYNLGEGYYSRELKERQFSEAQSLIKRGRYADAIALLRRAVVDCYTSAEYYLAYCHSHGYGVERNLEAALRWYGISCGRYSDWAKKDYEAVVAQLGECRGQLPEHEVFTDSEFGEIRVHLSTRTDYAQVSFAAGHTYVNQHVSEPYDMAVAHICRALVNADWRRQGYDYGRIDENFEINFPLFKLRIERGQRGGYSYKKNGEIYTIIVPYDVNFDNPCVREYIIKYGMGLLKRAAEEYLPQRVAVLSAQTGLYYSRCRVVAKSWGYYHYKSGVVSLSYFLMKCTAEFVDAVIIHELVHSLCKRHDKKFYDTLLQYGGERVVEVDKNSIGANNRVELL